MHFFANKTEAKLGGAFIKREKKKVKILTPKFGGAMYAAQPTLALHTYDVCMEHSQLSPALCGNASSGYPKVNTPHIPAQKFRMEQWETWHTSEKKGAQVALLHQARRAGEASGALDRSPTYLLPQPLSLKNVFQLNSIKMLS